MMRRLFLTGTTLFWLAIVAAMLLGRLYPVEEVKGGTVTERGIDLAEVAGHASASDCWMAINGKVYELSSYLPDHPSRPSIVLPWCGQEASEAYRTKMKGRPHSPRADQLLALYYIGELQPAELAR